MSVDTKEVLVDCVRAAGEILRQSFGQQQRVRIKDDPTSVVTEADLAAERVILDRLRAAFPDHGIVTEETGWLPGAAPFTWIIDPLDGTSNFAAGIPWFGVQIALMRERELILAAMYLPMEDTLYLGKRGGGVTRNGTRVRVTPETELKNVLCAFGLDAIGVPEQSRAEVELFRRVATRVRNVRQTNSLVDFCYGVDGRLGGCVNLNTRVWDIAPACLMFAEAGGRMTDLAGNALAFIVDAGLPRRSYAVVAGSDALHPQLVALWRGA